MNTTGGKKVMFGTNFPQLSWEKSIQQVADLGLRASVRVDFLGENARRVLKLGGNRVKGKL
jgi:uncharacterized protein